MPDVGKLTDILSGPLGGVAVQHLRVRPRQARSVESVERLLSAGAALAFGHRSVGTLSIERISATAGVTPQAAYRYFRDADELIATALRCVVLRDHEQLVTLMSGRVLSDSSELARTVVGFVLDSCEKLSRFPVHLQTDVIREYRQIGFESSRLMFELICRDVAETDVRYSLDPVKLSVAFTATIAVATSTSPRKMSLRREGKLDDMLAALFVEVLQSAGSAFDAFREMGIGFEMFWDDRAG